MPDGLRRVPAGRHIAQGLHLPPDQIDPLRIDKAIVRWVEKGQIGLEFVSLRLEELDRLCALSLTAERGRAAASLGEI